MTKNNLSQCLTWLFQQSHRSGQNCRHITLTAYSISSSKNDVESASTEEMARLNLAPITQTRPKLLTNLSTNIALPTPDPTRNTRETPSKSNPNTNITRNPYTPRLADTATTPRSLYEDSVFGDHKAIIDIDEFDLSLDSSITPLIPTPGGTREHGATVEDLHSSSTVPKRGTKRKSSEFELDQSTSQSPSRFGDVRNSQRKIKTKEESSGQVRDQISVHEPRDGDVQSFVESQVCQSSPSKSPVLNLKSDVAASPFTRPAIHSQPPQTFTRHDTSKRSPRRRNIVPDSDTEEISSPSSKFEDDTTYRTRSPHGKEKLIDLPQLQSHTGLQSTHISIEQGSNIESDSPGGNQFSIPGPDARIPSSSSSTVQNQILSTAQQDAVNRFMTVPVTKVKRLMDRLEQSKKSTNHQKAEAMCEYGTIPIDLQQRSKSIAKKIDATQKVLEQRERFTSATTERDNLKKRLHILLDDGQDVDPDEPNSEAALLCLQINKSKSQIDILEADLFACMEEAGLTSSASLEELPASPKKALNYSDVNATSRGVLVASTPGHARRSPSRNPAQVSENKMPIQNDPVFQTPLKHPKVSSTLSKTGRTEYNNHMSSQDKQIWMNHATTAANPSTTVGMYPEYVEEALLNNPYRKEAGFTRHMGSPPQASPTDEDFLGDMDDDNEMLDAAEAFEHSFDDDEPPSRLPMHQSREVFSELSENVRLLPTRHDTVKPRSPSNAALKKYEWSKDVISGMKKQFQLHGFRPNQLEAINATLGGKDAFVLMPTGGGKSLCYQLPSIVQSGKTRGVTIVISPLLSLMQDQVEHLQKLKIQAFLINSEVTAEHRSFVFSALRGPNVEHFIQLLYVTPEMLNKSQAMMNVFTHLHKQNKLARIVIDEAHCVSQWGHDFRPDYKALGQIRKQFEGVPVMALTATATENVKIDVMTNLEMEKAEVFTQSFNRPNLTYEVRRKGKLKDVLENIAETIKKFYRGQAGIIYCLSRANCEKIATQLSNDHGIAAKHYHAGMESQDRANVQKNWQSGKFKIIVATIAFGMGIDKPDVRFVIHHTIPKSLEGYYQETGRAGRDGKRSGCYLYYGYSDTSALKRMISDGEGSWEQKERQRQMLRNVIQFCENRSDCRRVQVLAYFNEHFSRDDCNNGCDNCTSQSVFETQDFSRHAQNAVRLVKHLKDQKVTVLNCADLYRGAKIKKFAELDLDELECFGSGASLERGDAERLFYRLLSEDALEEFNISTEQGFTHQYVKLGRNYRDFEIGRRSLKIQVRVTPNAKAKASTASKPNIKKTRGTGVKAAAEEYPVSTNVSSPLQPRGRRQINHSKRRADADDSEDGDLAYFEPVREYGKPQIRQEAELGPPITMDEKLTHLNDVHRYVLEDFVENAKKVLHKSVISKSLRQRPVSDTTLREMAIAFPQSKEEIMEISGMDEEKYRLHGTVLLRLVQSAHDNYEAMMRAQEDRPDDPNHKNVVEISDDNDDEYIDDGSDLFNQEKNDFPSEDDMDESQHSHYFNMADEVNAFNSHMSQIPMLPKAGSQSTFKKPAIKSRSNGRTFAKGRNKRSFSARGGGNSRGSSSSASAQHTNASTGVSKYVRSRGSNSSSSNQRTGNKSSRVGHAGGGISMMPT